MPFLPPPPPLRPYVNLITSMREKEEALAKSNPHMAQALETEKRTSHRLAAIARTIAIGIVVVVLPFLNPHPSIIVYEILMIIFIALGWLQLRVAKVGWSGVELSLILADLILMTLALVMLNPWGAESFPNPYVYQHGNFLFFFVILAVATLAFSWRTVWTIGTMTGLIWVVATALVAVFGKQIPELTVAINSALPDFPIVASQIDPNSVRWPLRIQEAIVFVLVAGILAIKGWRTNQLLVKQALVASERANLSRYFPSSLVDTLASTDHDIGAVRSQEIAVMFSDIVGFTKIAESMTPDEVMSLLRDYHALVERAVFQNSGTLDKYLGDGVMATFGTPIPGSDDAVNAFAAARQIIADAEHFNFERNANGKEPIKISVGLHFGTAILGDIGPERRLEFAVVGDSVNVASRIEAATRQLKCSCAVSDDLMRKVMQSNCEVPDEFTLKKNFRLKGRSEAIDIWIDQSVEDKIAQ